MHSNDKKWLKEAIQVSVESCEKGGYPVGAVMVKDNELVATGISDGKQQCDATLHAEIDAIRKASKQLGTRNLSDCILYTSMEPCIMCFSASMWAYIPKVVYAAPKQHLDAKHFMTNIPLTEIQHNSRRSIELLHCIELEPEALEIIHTWETKNRTT